MNLAAIIIASAFAGILLLVMIGGMAFLIFMHIRLRRENAELLAKMEAFGQGMASMIEDSTSEMNRMIEGARASFTGIRQDIKAGQDAQGALIGEALKLHDRNFKNAMGKLNPVALEATAVKIIQAASMVGKASQTLTMMLSGMETTPAGAADLLPDQYGPDDTIYAKQSETARLDDAFSRLESEENQPLYGMVGEQ